MTDPGDLTADVSRSVATAPSLLDELTPAQHARLCAAALLLISVLDEEAATLATAEQTLPPGSTSAEECKPSRPRRNPRRLSGRRRSGHSATRVK
jgi:hypothetical protein